MSRQLHWPTLEEMKEQKERYHDWFYHHPNVVHALKAFGMAFVLTLAFLGCIFIYVLFNGEIRI